MQLLKRFKILTCASVAALIGAGSVSAADWPMWRFESNRSAISPEVLTDSLYLQWIRTYNPPQTAWDNQGEQDAYGSTTDSVTPQTGKLSNDKKYLSFDIAYQPIVVGTTMLFGSPNDDKFSAVDVTTGAEKWHFFAGAPIRFAPVAKNGKVYFGSDDGYLYCLNISDGSLVWKFNGTPNSRKVLGNDRLTSVWPVRGAPVIPNSSAIAPTQAYLDWNASHNKRYIIASGTDDKQESSTGTVTDGASGIALNQFAAFRFSHSSYKLNQGATIDSAFVQFMVSDTTGGTAACTLSVYAAALDSAVELGSFANALSAKPRTTASVDWVVPNWDTLNSQKAKQRTPNLKPLLQELVSRTGWNPKSRIILLLTKKSGNGARTVYSMDQSSSKAAYLTIYSSGLVVDSTTQPTPTVTQSNTDTNTVYFAAGLYPYEGVFVYALDAATGNLKWINDGNSMQYSVTPHGTSESFTGLAPQGYFCTGINNSLIIPNGRAYPACLDRATGTMKFFNVSSGNGYHVVSQLDQIYVGSQAFNINTFASSGTTPSFFNGNNIQIQAGSKIYSAGALNDTTLGHAPIDSSTYSVSCGSWARNIIGKPAGLLAANGYLFVTTTTGKIYCFGSTQVANPPVISNSTVSTASDANNAAAADIITRSGYTQGNRGIAIVIGLTNGRICEELAKQSDLTVIGIDPDSSKVKKIRERLDSTGLYGYKVHLIAADIRTAGLPQYIAQIITTESVDAGFADIGISPYDYIEALYHSIRPYGGTACLPISQTVIQRAVTTRNLSGASVTTSGTYTLLTRAGRVPGSADRTCQFGDAAHSNFVKDSLAKAPVGVIWFGGSSDNTNDKMNSRHGHGPIEQVVGGHYYMQGPNTLRCVDLYTGRVLWEKNILRFGEFSDYTEHEGGQTSLGDNYVSTEDAIYTLGEHDMNKPPKKCYVFDPNTGATKNTFTLPDSLGAWGLLSVCDSFIVATSQPLMYDSAKLGNGFVYWYSGNTSLVGVGGNSTLNGTTGNRLVVLNRYTGKILWNRLSQFGYYNVAVVSGNGKVFVIDKSPAKVIGMLKRTGVAAAPDSAKVEAFDLHTGAMLWVDSSSAVFGRYLALSKDHNILLEASNNCRDYMVGEPAANKMVARNATTGAILWQRTADSASYYGGPVILADTNIITQDGNNFGMINLNTGKWQTVNFGLSGRQDNFYFYRHYGCNFGIGALNMITFRSGAPSYFDLNKMDGCTNIAGSKSGCTNSVVPADAVVLAAEYTRTCSCMYSIQTSSAMVYNPDGDRWTCNDGLTSKIKRQGFKLQNVGIALGAPGDRRDDNGTLWTEYPTGEDKVGFPTYPLPITVSVTGDSAKYFRHNSARVSGDGLKWVAASGVEGASKVTLNMVKDSIDGTGAVVPHTTTNDLYNVTLYFMEPNVNAKVGDRVFDAYVNGTLVCPNLDLVKKTGGAMKAYNSTITDVSVGDKLEITLTAKTGKPVLSGFSVVKKGLIPPVAVKQTTKSMLNKGLKYYDGSESLGNTSVDAINDGVKAGIKAGLKK